MHSGQLWSSVYSPGFWSLDPKPLGQNCGDGGRWWNCGDPAENHELPEAALYNDHGMCSTVCLFSARSCTEVMLSGYLLILLWAVTFLPSPFLLLHSFVTGFSTSKHFWKAARKKGITRKKQETPVIHKNSVFFVLWQFWKVFILSAHISGI